MFVFFLFVFRSLTFIVVFSQWKQQAQGMPDYTAMAQQGVAVVKPAALVEPVPFELASERRGAEHRAQMERKLREQAEREEAVRHFHAQPVPDADPAAMVRLLSLFSLNLLF